MPRLVLSVLLVLAFVAPAAAQTTSATISLTRDQSKAGGFRDIPPGPRTFQVTLQSSSGTMSNVGLSGSNPQVTWVPQGSTSNVTSATWTTSTTQTESTIGTVSGWAFFMGGPPPGYGYGTCYTTNAFWSDICDPGGSPYGCSPGGSGGTYYDARFPLNETSNALPSAYPTDARPWVVLPTFSISNFHTGEVWFTSSDSTVAVYRFETSQQTWVKADQPATVTATQGTNFPGGPYRIARKAGGTEGALVPMTLNYRSAESTNPQGTADSMDILLIDFMGPYNKPL